MRVRETLLAGLFGLPLPPEPARDADGFARAVIAAICGAGVSAGAGRQATERCLRALGSGATARIGFRHPGKADAVDRVWQERHRLYQEYLASPDRPAFLQTLPQVGPVIGRRLARDLAGDPAETDLNETREAA